MTLTEQWKKGKLKQGEYWCKITESPYIEQVYLPCCDDIIVEVLAPVPSYEEWRELSKQRNRLIRDINGLAYIQEENAKLRKWCEEFNALDVAKENQQLKWHNEYLRNIIKECEPYIENVCTALNMEKFANGDFSHKSNEVLSKIRTAIGEKK